MFYLRYLWLIFCTNIKLILAFKGAFILTLVITIAKQFLFLISWKFFFQRYTIVQGWSFNDMLLMYGIVSYAMGATEVFFYGMKELPERIEDGTLDTYLLQPKNVLINIAISKGYMPSIGEVIAGIVLIFYSGYFETDFFSVLFILIISLVFMFSLMLYLSCIAFFLKNSTDFIRELSLNSIIIATQPNSAYRGAFKIFTLTILPVGFLSFFPIEYVRTHSSIFFWITLFGTSAFLGIACWLFKKGLTRYESGNLFAYRN